MYKVILILSLMLGFETLAGEAPEKFQNLIFNNKLYSAGKKVFSHDILITPTYITDYDNEDSDAKCEYITEDERAYNNVDCILLLFHFSWLPTTLHLHLFIACIALYFNWLCPCILSLYHKLLKRQTNV